MNKNNKPIHFLILKILGFMGVVIAVIGFSLSISGFGDFESNNFMIGGLMVPFGLMLAVPCLVNGFRPEIAKMNTKSIKFIQEENKDDLKDIANNTAEITQDAITTTAEAVKKGFQDTKFCKHCGAKIDSDSKFCSKCGKEQ